jgi:SAM-dependent methyltransferase
MNHLDLGCGGTPFNPYNADKIFGVDIYQPKFTRDVVFKQADLSTQGIPFESDFFDSVSAFDVIEHIPRIIQYPTINDTRFSFIELMNEAWRVLKHGGLFYAVTPAYPRPEAFMDPTHVNFITDQTHIYFCEESVAKNYGFHGRFEKVNVRWDHPQNLLKAGNDFRRSMRRITRALEFRKPSHILWEFRAIK